MKPQGKFRGFSGKFQLRLGAPSYMDLECIISFVSLGENDIFTMQSACKIDFLQSPVSQ